MRPDIIAIIPARGGSKRIPRKNLMPLAGRPLIAHSILHAKEAKCVTDVYVSTDDVEIGAVARAMGVKVVKRPEELASDTAPSESALLHVLDARSETGTPDPDLIVFLQCTCPVRRPDDVDRAVDALQKSGADSLLSGCRETPFIWRVDERGPQSLTYDYRKRIRTQDWQPHYRENGSIYVLKPWILREHNNRLGGKIVVHEMDFWCSFDIDSMEDANLVQWILRERDGRASDVKLRD